MALLAWLHLGAATCPATGLSALAANIHLFLACILTPEPSSYALELTERGCEKGAELSGLVSHVEN